MVIWLFTRGNDGNFRRLSYAKFDRFLEGQGSLLDHAADDGFVYVAEVPVQMESRRAISIGRMSFSKLRINEHGTSDQEHWNDGMEAAVGQLPGLIRDSNVSGASRFAKRRYEVQHSFTLTPMEQENLRAAINSRAKKTIT